MLDCEALRRRMVDSQIRPAEVTDYNVIRTFMSVPREKFVPPNLRPFAYTDRELAIASGASGSRHLIPPVHSARMIQALELRPADVVLLVACGTGYSAAVLARLCGSVVAVEEDEALLRGAEARLSSLGIDNVAIVQGRLVEGYPSEAPYDAILIDGAVEVLPDAIGQQLGERGRMAVIQRDERISRAMLYERTGSELTGRAMFEAWASVLPGFRREPAFVF